MREYYRFSDFLNLTLERLASALADRYRVERELGQGGMATVYLAHDLRHQRDVAIKVLHPDLGAALGSERFLSEIRTTARLQHPHILPLLDSGEADGLLYYVMPLVTGETLRTRLERERQLPIDVAVLIAREVADALGYAHGLNVIHRDIKPENILLQGGHALVADFGIALAVQSAGGQRMTQTGLSLGTPQYMSPEQAMGERAIDARSDIYALGAVTYEMLAGDPPFTGSSVQAIVARVMTEKPSPIRTVRDTVSPQVEHAVLTALAKLPADRFATAPEFATALSNPTGASQHTHLPMGPAAAGGRRVAVPLLAAVLAVAALWGWLRPMPSSPVVRYSVPLDSLASERDAWGQLALSRDGSVFAYGSGPNGSIRVKRRSELELIVVPSTEGGRAPFFSPDGSMLGYTVNNKLFFVPLGGGPAILYADSLVGVQNPKWESDGYIYGVSRGTNRASRGIWRMEATPGGALSAVTQVDTTAEEEAHYWPTLLPGGKSVLFIVGYRGRGYSIAVGDVGGEQHTVLVAGIRALYADDGHILYSTVDGKLWRAQLDVGTRKLTGTPSMVAERLRTTVAGPVDFAVSASGTLVYAADESSPRRELVWVKRDGTTAQVDSNWSAPFVSPVLSPDASMIAVSLRTPPEAEIWVKPLVAGAAPMRLTLPPGLNEGPAWTPDGKSVSYIPGTGIATSVWIKSLTGGEVARPLIQFTKPLSEHVWSPDGRWHVVRTTTGSSGAGDILGAGPSDSGLLRPVLATPNTEYNPSVSPDGRFMTYASDEGGRFEVYVVPFPDPSGQKWQLSTGGGALPTWSPTGGEIFYLDAGSNFVSTRVSVLPTFSVGPTTRLFGTYQFAIEGYSRRNYDVAPDGQRFLMVRRGDGAAGSSVVVVENWIEERQALNGKPE